MGSNADLSRKHAMHASYILLHNESIMMLTDRGKRRLNVGFERQQEHEGLTSVLKVYPLSEVRTRGKTCSGSAYILRHVTYNCSYE